MTPEVKWYFIIIAAWAIVWYFEPEHKSQLESKEKGKTWVLKNSISKSNESFLVVQDHDLL